MGMFWKGDVVRITSGPFADFTGVVEEVDSCKDVLTVSVEIFGRPTPVQVADSDVEDVYPRLTLPDPD